MLGEIKSFIKEKPEIILNYWIAVLIITAVFLFAVRIMEVTVLAYEPQFTHSHIAIEPANIWQMTYPNARAGLKGSIGIAQMRCRTNYTAESWRLFEQALSSAIGVLHRPTSVEPEIFSTINNLYLRRINLVPIPIIQDCLERLSIYSEIRALEFRNLYNYTEESRMRVITQIRAAYLAINNPVIAQAQLTDIRGNLTVQISRLEPEIQRDWLEPLILETTEAKLTYQTWLVALCAFSLGISVMTMFSILWSRCR